MSFDRKKAAVICFTQHGKLVAKQTAKALLEAGMEPCIFSKQKETGESGNCLQSTNDILELSGSLKEWTGERFLDSALIVFVSATGIAVRLIAPFLKSKTSDPAVLVIDEQGKFVISLVSGHIGGANEMALCLSRQLKAIPVITTATDLNGKFAVDVFAEKNNLRISDLKLAKDVAARLLNGETLVLSSEFPIAGRAPEELKIRKVPLPWFHDRIREDAGMDEDKKGTGMDILVSVRALPEKLSEGKTLVLTPRVLYVGMGCRKEKDPAEVEAFFKETLQEAGISVHAVAAIASIDLKKDEPALNRLAQKLNVPFVTFDAQQLRSCEGAFTPSAFVTQTTGVDNVCERSAVLSADGGRLIRPKVARDGMTLAIALGKGELHFE